MIEKLFGKIDSYSAMLFRICVFTGFIAFIISILMAYLVPSYEMVFVDKLSIKANTFDIKIPLGHILVGSIVALLTRIVKLHDRISDMLNIREEFDTNNILLPMATEVLDNIGVPSLDKLKSHRKELMRKIFYKYASTDPSKSAIDSHYVHMALDAWTWYWIFLEWAVVSFVASLIFLGLASILGFFICFIFSLLLLLFMKPLKSNCIRQAENEIIEIISNDDIKNEIAKVLIAL